MALSSIGIRTRDLLEQFGYTLLVTVGATAALVALTGAWPVGDVLYAPMALAFAAGLLLTVRLAPYQPGGALVLLPAMALSARFGLAALPMIAYVGVVIALLRGVRGPRVITTTAHMLLAY